MKELKDLLQDKTVEVDAGKRSARWRDEYIDAFTDRLNWERKKESYNRFKVAQKNNPTLTPEEFKKTKEYLKPLTKRFVAIKIAHCSQMDLHYLLKRCEEGNFGKVFFGALKPKPAR